ncbi:MAG: GatB/YqeY domain-containing protein [Chloroflexi bacterium]|nr:GatB/YqeY domain-containing protein [Chloroflexota bacterium]MCY3938227.1 GatB/YqeY domain-containing protein [Chloroflexota bacterium]
MPVADQIFEDLKQAMRDRDKARVTALRFIRSEIQKAEKASRKPLDDSAVVQNLATQARRRRESIEEYKKARREELVAKETAELDIILSYMPKQLSREEIADAAREIIADVQASAPRDMGKVMGPLMARLRGRADGATCSQIVRELLGA